ncbi:MAG TPA: winged helix DNA-binding domain-containing protein [Longimicrobiales bacterium]|nr:winged helix DNA-binding domain-containing protein [Longimicrobiales bacterium]
MDKITTRALNRALLARQFLLQRTSNSPLSVIEHLVGMQSQSPTPPYYGLWSRIENFQPEDLSRLIASRKVVRMTLMRTTIHLVSAKDCVAIRPLMQPVIERMVYGGYGRMLAGCDVPAIAKAGRKLVEEEPLTYGELASLLQVMWPDVNGQAMANAVRAHIPLVQVPPRGLWGKSGAAVHTSMEQWLKPKTKPRLSLEKLLLRYLGAFGPASVRDMQMWSGLTRLSEIVAKFERKLVKFQDSRGVVLYDLPNAPRPDEDLDAPVRLLPEWDNALLSYVDRSRIVEDKWRQRIYTVNGIIPGTVLIDGFVCGVWKIKRDKKKAGFSVEYFSRISREQRAEVNEEGERCLTFAPLG